VTLFEGAEGVPAPAALAAVTVKVYRVPLVRPSTAAPVALAAAVAVSPPGLEVTV
jgi:hypothetical protein